MSDISKAKFTPEEVALLMKYVTNTSGKVFAVSNLQGILGAVFARYSRAQGDFRDILLKEFINEGQLDPKKAEALIERVLIAFGDDSVGELENCALSLTTSILATKEWEDRRIGGSPIEKSTRYVFFDKKDEDGNYGYLTPFEIKGTKLEAIYVEAMNFTFSTYSSLIAPLQDYYRGQKSIDDAEYDINNNGTKQRYADLSDPEAQKKFRNIYTADVRTKACDTLRAILPLATLTNVGISGNGRFFQAAISHCLTSPFAEVRNSGQEAFEELSKIIPQYVKRAAPNKYIQETNATLASLAKELFEGIPPTPIVSPNTPEVSMLNHGEAETAEALRQLVFHKGINALDASAVGALRTHEETLLMLSFALYPHLQHSLTDIRATLRTLHYDTIQRIKAALVGVRHTRRDRPGRSLEACYPFTFDMCTEFGTYKDLQRHRMTTQIRQAFTPTIGFVMPADIVAIGCEAQVLEVNARMVELYHKLAASPFPHVAAYTTLHGSLVRWVMGGNDRAFMHLVELRTTPQGHPSYRKASQQMHTCIAQTPGLEWRAEAMQFVDYKEYNGWARGDSEAKQQAKLAALETKGA